MNVQKDKLDTFHESDLSPEGIFLHNRQISFVVAGMLVFSCFVFIAGYFFGQQRVIEPFSSKAEQDSLADTISSSMYSLYDKSDEEIAYGESEVDTTLPVDEYCSLEKQIASPTLNNESTDNSAPKSEGQETLVTSAKHYYAELIGFGSLPAAQEFVQRLSKKGINVIVKTRTSKSARGKIVSWYQVVTPLYESQQELTSCIDMIKYSERLKGVRIVTC